MRPCCTQDHFNLVRYGIFTSRKMICLNWAGGPEQGNKMPLGVPVYIRVSV